MIFGLDFSKLVLCTYLYRINYREISHRFFLKKVYCKYSQKKRTCDYVVIEIQKIVMKLLKQLTLHLNLCWETRKTITFGEIVCDDLDVTSTSYLIKIGPLSI